MGGGDVGRRLDDRQAVGGSDADDACELAAVIFDCLTGPEFSDGAQTAIRPGADDPQVRDRRKRDRCHASGCEVPHDLVASVRPHHLEKTVLSLESREKASARVGVHIDPRAMVRTDDGSTHR
jgi:hypothetical protein